MTDNTKARVEDHIRRNFSGARSKHLQDDMSLRGDLGGYDLDVVQMVMDLEDAFAIDITDDEDEALRTVGDVHELVAAKLAEKERQAA